MFEAQNISFQKNGKQLLNNISCQIQAGFITGVLGANGAGKSTLLKILSHEYRPTKGNLYLDKQKLTQKDTIRLAKKRAIIAQNENIITSLKVLDYVLLGRLAHNSAQYSEKDYISAYQALAIVGAAKFTHENYNTLSGGERQIIQLARALTQLDTGSHYSGYLLLDEFNSSMDIYHQQATLELLKKLCKTNPLGILIICHDLNLAFKFFDNCILLKTGKLIASGNLDNVLTSENIYTAYQIKSERVLIGNSYQICYL